MTAPQTPLDYDDVPPESINNMVDSDAERQARYDAVPEVPEHPGFLAPQEDLSGAHARAMGESASMQAEAQAMLDSQAGSGEFTVTSGSTAGWPANLPTETF